MRYRLFAARDHGRPFPLVLREDEPAPTWPGLHLVDLGLYADRIGAALAWESPCADNGPNW